MANFFLDTSALVKHYVNEVGSGWVSSLVSVPARNWIRLASLTCVEVIAAIARRQRGGTIAAADAVQLIGLFQFELARIFRAVDITPAVIAKAMQMAEKHGLRGSDAVQLAIALEVHQDCLAAQTTLTVVSADAELNAAARAEGLTVDDPNNHP